MFWNCAIHSIMPEPSPHRPRISIVGSAVLGSEYKVYGSNPMRMSSEFANPYSGSVISAHTMDEHIGGNSTGR